MHWIYISIREFCVWLIVQHDLNRDWTNTITFVHFTHLLPLGEIVMGRIEPLNFWLPHSSLSQYTILLTNITCKFLFISSYAHLHYANTQCTCHMGTDTLHMHVKFTLHTLCMHTPNMPYTCHKPVLHRLQVHCILAARMPYIGGTLSTYTHSWMQRHIVLHARVPQAQCTDSVCTHDVCMVHTRNTQTTHIPHSPASHMPHMSHTQVCCRHAKDTHCVHIACKPRATHACMHDCMHTNVMHTHSTYLFCMHTTYTHICRLLATACLLHAKNMWTLSMNAQINATLTQAIYMHTSHKRTTPTHHAACKPHV